VNRRATRFVLVAGLAAAIAVPAVLAATIDDVVVGVPGRNDTRGFSQKLFVEVMTEDEYTKVDFDGDSGNWLGPPYHSTLNPNLGGRANASWSVDFDKGLSVEQAQAKHFVQGWAPFQEASIEVPHVVGQTRVAIINGQWRLTKGPGDHNNQFEGVLSFPLCKRVVVSAEFAFLDPSTDVDNLGGQYRVQLSVGDKDAFSWNRDTAILAPTHVALKGYLPAASITADRPNVQTANADPHEIVGFVRDCTGAVMPSVPVHSGKISGRTNGRGFYLLHMRKAGTYRVKASAGGGTVTSRRVHVP
jgi:hypothetical protein